MSIYELGYPKRDCHFYMFAPALFDHTTEMLKCSPGFVWLVEPGLYTSKVSAILNILIMPWNKSIER